MDDSVTLNREVTSLNSEKKMSALAIKGYQNSISEQLRGSMGQDMNDVLSGKKKVKLSFWQRVNYNIKVFLSHFNNVDSGDNYE